MRNNAVIVVGLLCLLGSSVAYPQFVPNPSSSYKEVQSSWSVLLGATHQIIATQEECRKNHPAIGSAIDAAFHSWKMRHSFMDAVREAVYHRAKIEGGEAEAARLSREMTASHKEHEPKVRDFAQRMSESQCDAFAKKLNSGTFDFKQRYETHIRTILGKLP